MEPTLKARTGDHTFLSPTSYPAQVLPSYISGLVALPSLELELPRN
jgi:hypothetical protein